MGTPILSWQPGGGVPITVIPPIPPAGRVAGEFGITLLTEGQSYVDVVFVTTQPRSDWTFVEMQVVNTVDAEPLNIWPGIVSAKTRSGFRLELNGLPDSGNYRLYWSIGGATESTGGTATAYTLSGPESGGLSEATAFVVALPAGTSVDEPVTITPDDAGDGGAFAPLTVELTSDSPSANFTYTPASYGVKAISTMNDGLLDDPDALIFTVVVDTYTLSGPSTGLATVASTNFTVALPVGGVTLSTITVTPSAGDGTFTPATVTLTTASPSATFTYTPVSSGAKTISTTNNRGLTDPAPLTYNVPVDPSTITGLKLWLKADSLALADGAAVSTWTDSSGSGNDVTQATGANQPIFKTNIVNTKPVLRFDGVNDELITLTFTGIPTVSTFHSIFVVCSAASISSGSHSILIYSRNSPAATAIFLRRDTNTLNYYHWDGGLVLASEASAIAAGAWNVITADWNGSNIHLWRNGTLKDTTGATLFPVVGAVISIGAADTGAGGSGFWDGDIAEILIYNSALGITDRTNVEDYLRAKYGIP